MVIDPKIEDPTRTMLGQAIRGELHELNEMIDTIGDVYGMVIAYCALAAAYIAIDLSERWPTEGDVREMARHAATTSRHYELSQQDIYDYISRIALGGEDINDIFPDADVDIKLPVLITARLLVAFRAPREMGLWEYLDTIWNALNAVEHTDLSILPALMLQSHKVRAATKK